MENRMFRKLLGMLLLISMCVSMINTPVFAADNKTVISKAITKSARYVEPEEWNKQELLAYSFDSGKDISQYMTTGGMHLYNKNYKGKDHWVKITLTESGLFYIMTASDDGKIKIYDSSKKKILTTLEAEENTEYLMKANAGDVFYVKLPDKIDIQLIVTGVLKDGFGTMKAGDSYGESGKGKTIYHPFSITKRSKTQILLKAINKNNGNVTVQIEKNVKNKWQKIGYKKTIKPYKNVFDTDKSTLINGLEKGKYRVALKASKEQVYAIAYAKKGVKKNVAYKKSKAKKINTVVSNLYTQEEKAARWYKFTRKASDKENMICIKKTTEGGGFKFTFYKQGKKKPIKTVKIKSNSEYAMIGLPKGKGTYYIKVEKLTKKTNGIYDIVDWNAIA